MQGFKGSVIGFLNARGFVASLRLSLNLILNPERQRMPSQLSEIPEAPAIDPSFLEEASRAWLPIQLCDVFQLGICVFTYVVLDNPSGFQEPQLRYLKTDLRPKHVHWTARPWCSQTRWHQRSQSYSSSHYDF